MNNLYVAKYGRGFPLVFFHGWGFDHHIWLDLVNGLQAHYQLYLVDLPGFGRSPSMTWAQFKKKLLAQLPSETALIGWSLGGLIATRLALEEPARTCHLVNLASSPRFLKETNWPGIEPAAFNNFFKILVASPQQAIQQFMRLQLREGDSNANFRQFIPELEGLQAGLEILATWDLREPLKNFTKPTCFMFGRLDAIIPRTTITAMQKIYPTFKYLMFAKAAHIPFLSHPSEFLEFLQDFLQ